MDWRGVASPMGVYAVPPLAGFWLWACFVLDVLWVDDFCGVVVHGAGNFGSGAAFGGRGGGGGFAFFGVYVAFAAYVFYPNGVSEARVPFGPLGVFVLVFDFYAAFVLFTECDYEVEAAELCFFLGGAWFFLSFFLSSVFSLLSFLLSSSRSLSSCSWATSSGSASTSATSTAAGSPSAPRCSPSGGSPWDAFAFWVWASSRRSGSAAPCSPWPSGGGGGGRVVGAV